VIGIVNPAAAHGKSLEAVREHLLKRGFSGEFLAPKDSDEANRFVRERASAADAILVGGGDGSIAALVPSILETKLPLAVVPLGTANDFARSLDLPHDLDEICDMLVAGYSRRVDVGRIGEQYFINTIAGGLPAQAAIGLTSRLKARLGMFAAVALIPKLVRTAKAVRVTVRGESIAFTTTSLALLVGNGRYVGGIPVRYEAVDDGLLHLTICRARSFPELLSVAFSALLRRLPQDWNVIDLSSPWFEIQTAKPWKIAVDGDVTATTPLRAEVLPGAVEVFVRSPKTNEQAR